MALPLTLTARVQPGHKLEIVAPELTEGDEVTILVTKTVTATADLYAPTLPEVSAALARRLLEIGAIPFIPTGRTEPSPPPIIVRGRPVSETIIEERR